METIKQVNFPSFDEGEWIRLIFLLNDTKVWLEELTNSAFIQLPIADRKKLFRRSCHLSIPAMCHIIERHYHKIQRHPNTGKFSIPITRILEIIRDASHLDVFPIAGSSNLQRSMDTESFLGFDRNGLATSVITIITDNSGNIITAFPGAIQ